MSTESRADKFTTVMLRKETRVLLKDAALGKEALWETIDRVTKEYLVNRLKKE